MPTIITRSGTSFARSPVIDGHLTDEIREKVYAKWEEESLPFDHFGGGVKGITCTHILEVGFSTLSKLFGPKRAKELLEIAEKNEVV